VRSLLVLLTAASVAFTAAPARADSWQARDAAGDVHGFAYSPEPPPCGSTTDTTDPTDELRDITRLAVDHQASTVEISLSLREVRRRGRGTSYTLHVRTPTKAFEVWLLRDSKGRMDPLLVPAIQPPDTGADDCGRQGVLGPAGPPCVDLASAIDPRRDVIVVSIPRRCLKDPAWVKVGARAFGGFSGSLADGFVLHDDSWAPPGVEPAGLVPPLGPRVRAGRPRG
jgi:hypothetical protein